MNIQQHDGFYVVGLTARTNNAQEMSGKGKIGEVWQEFLRPDLVVKIPNKMGVDLIAVYTDYETDHTGHYTYLLGIPISSAEALPSNLTVKHIPAGRYAVFRSERGPKRRSFRRCGNGSGRFRRNSWGANVRLRATLRSTINVRPIRRMPRSMFMLGFARRFMVRCFYGLAGS